MRIQTPQQKYIEANFGLNDPELKVIREELHKQNLDFMSISSSEARLLQFLIKTTGAQKIVEVGTLFGYSALAMTKALPEDGQLWTLEKNEKNYAIATEQFKKFPSASHKIKALQGDATSLLKEIQNQGPFDLIFIDADKAAYPKYLDWAEANIRKGGYIVGDNTFLWGGVWDEPFEQVSPAQVAGMKEFNLRLSDLKKYNSTIIPTVEGMTVAQKLS